MRSLPACKRASPGARRESDRRAPLLTARASRVPIAPMEKPTNIDRAAERRRRPLVLGIETSCDETAAAVVARDEGGDGRILSSVVRAQWEEHRRFGGVVPEIAARAHVECLDEIVAQAMRDASVGFEDLAAVAVTAGPGLIGGLLVGLATAK